MNTILIEWSKLLLFLEHSAGHWEQSSEPNSHGPAFVKFKPLLKEEITIKNLMDLSKYCKRKSRAATGGKPQGRLIKPEL